MTRTASPLLRWLEPLPGAVWIGFWVWTVLAGTVWIAGIGDAEVASWTHRHFASGGEAIVGEVSPLERALSLILAIIDPVWIVLAAVNAYLSLAGEEGLAHARRWSGWVLAAGLATAWLTVKTGWPLGALLYTTRLGPRLGPVPLGYPLLWLVLILGGRELSRRCSPRVAHWQIAAMTGALVFLSDLNLEPIACQRRVWWLWIADRPDAVHYLAYALIGTALAWLCRSGGERLRQHTPGRAAAVLLALNALCLLTHLARWLRPDR